jgi:hypothetical protein
LGYQVFPPTSFREVRPNIYFQFAGFESETYRIRLARRMIYLPAKLRAVRRSGGDMDWYISKPIRARDLLELVETHARENSIRGKFDGSVVAV